MYSLLFRNKLVALGFVALFLIGVATLVGTEDNAGVLSQTAQSLDTHRSDFDETVKELETPAPQPTIMADAPEPAEIPPASDEALIDEATGYDPTPIDPDAPLDPKAIEESEDVVIILNNER
ncbi:MAG: hypothetical protein WA908_05055 [Pontixanthobacter sp.]